MTALITLSLIIFCTLPENSKVYFVPLFGKDFRLLPRQGLHRPVELQDGELHRLQLGIEADCELGLSASVGDPDEVPLAAAVVAVVAERRHEAELLGDALVENAAEKDDCKCSCNLFSSRTSQE